MNSFRFAAAVLAAQLALAGAALAQSADTAAAGGEGSDQIGYGGPTMAGHLPVSGVAYNDGTR
jgi:hypothetical protein